jgi:excinuclease UvrABC ATPase subunit
MRKLDLKEVPKRLKPNPIFKGLSSKLKDPANYKDIEDKLQAILKSTHNHKTATSYAKCKECQSKRLERQKMMKDIGFKSIQQYLTWKKIMEIIINQKSFQLK